MRILPWREWTLWILIFRDSRRRIRLCYLRCKCLTSRVLQAPVPTQSERSTRRRMLYKVCERPQSFLTRAAASGWNPARFLHCTSKTISRRRIPKGRDADRDMTEFQDKDLARTPLSTTRGSLRQRMHQSMLPNSNLKGSWAISWTMMQSVSNKETITEVLDHQWPRCPRQVHLPWNIQESIVEIDQLKLLGLSSSEDKVWPLNHPRSKSLELQLESKWALRRKLLTILPRISLKMCKHLDPDLD